MFEEEQIEEAIPTDDATGSVAQQSTMVGPGGGLDDLPVGDGTPSFEGGVPMPAPRPQQGIGAILEEGGVGPQGPIKKIISYLMGAGAAAPPEIAQAGVMVDPRGELPASDRNLLALERAAQTGGKEAAWKLLQGHRTAFNAKQAFGFAALRGTEQKPADLNAAIDAANQAQAHVLDGSEVQFAAGPGGITATVRAPDGRPSTVQLTPDQFRAYLDPGNDGQYDKLTQPGGIPAVLQKIVAGQVGAAQQKPAAQTEAIDTSAPVPEQQARQQPRQQPRGERGTDISTAGYPRQLEEAASRLFPWASQSQQREAWLQQQMGAQADRENKVNVARETGLYKVGAAEATGQSRQEQERIRQEGTLEAARIKAAAWEKTAGMKVEAAKAALQQRINEMNNRNATEAQRLQLKHIQNKVLTLQELDDAEKKFVASLPGMAGAGQTMQRPGITGQPAQQPAAPAQQQQQQQQQSAAPPPANQRVAGQTTVTTKKGTFVWNGTGWDPR